MERNIVKNIKIRCFFSYIFKKNIYLTRLESRDNMDKIDIIRNITERTGGDIYLGVVGAVRTGKSTFIKRFLENLIVPNIEDEYEKKRALDEIPQSAQGKTIMTTEPKFVPNNTANKNR